MSWRKEASGVSGRMLVTIDPDGNDGPQEGPMRVRIRVTPTGGLDWPMAPILPRGHIYRDRTGDAYTILACETTEHGGDDGESSIWTHTYYAIWGVHSLTGLPA